MNTLLSLSNGLAAAVEAVAPSVVAVNARPRLPSTGIHWRPGIVVTADHTVRADEDITVTRSDGHTTPATLAGRDPGTDLAVLRVRDADFPTAAVADPGTLHVGHLVLAVGYGPRVSWGVVSALGGRWRTGRGAEVDQLMRLDVTFYPGFSGGPLVDAEGRVVGVNSSGLSRQLELAIPATTVSRIADELLEKGRVARGFLGVGLHAVPLPEAWSRALPTPAEIGLMVVSLQPDGPAGSAGVMLGDVLVAIDGVAVPSSDDVQRAVGTRPVGSPVTATILRGGSPKEIRITLGERPARRRH
jgi:S1-C subfamily serine protease